MSAIGVQLTKMQSLGCLIQGAQIQVFLRKIQDSLLTLSLENDGDDKTVDTEDTSHNNRNEGLEDEVALEDTDGGNTDA